MDCKLPKSDSPNLNTLKEVKLESITEAKHALRFILGHLESKENFRKVFHVEPVNVDELNWAIRICDECDVAYAVPLAMAEFTFFCCNSCRRSWYEPLSDSRWTDLLNVEDKPMSDNHRQQVREDHKYRCAYCGIPQVVLRYFDYSDNRMNVHHDTKRNQILTFHYRDHPTNLSCVCPTCHKRLDRRMAQIGKEADRVRSGEGTDELSEPFIRSLLQEGRFKQKSRDPPNIEKIAELNVLNPFEQ